MEKQEADVFETTEEAGGSAEVLISISQANRFAAMVAEGKFASIDDAIAHSADELNLTRVGGEMFSSEARDRLKRSIEQADRGELISSEEVERKFEAWFNERNERTAAGGLKQ